MFAKLLLIILIAGATGGALLVNRQQRIDTAHDIAQSHQRLNRQEQVLWRLRTEIAGRVRPEDVRRRMHELGGVWVAMPDNPAIRRPRATRLAGVAEDEPAPDFDHHEEDLGG